MEKIDKVKCILIDFETSEKTLDEAAKEILLLFSFGGQSEQLKCVGCGNEFIPHLIKPMTICDKCADSLLFPTTQQYDQRKQSNTGNR